MLIMEGDCLRIRAERSTAYPPDRVLAKDSVKFLAVVSNLETGEPLWLGRERKRETLDRYFAEACLFAAIEAHVQAVIREALPKLQGLVTTETGVDDTLAGIVNRVVVQGLREHGSPDVADDLCGAMTLLIARNAAARARDGMLHCLLVVKGS